MTKKRHKTDIKQETGMKIIFLSHTPRNSIFKVGSTHLSRAFSQMGYQVLYISSAVSPFHLINVAGLKNDDYRNSLKNRLLSYKPRRDEDNVLNLAPFVLAPFNRGIFDNPKIPLNQWFTFNRMGKQLKKIGFDKADLVIQDKPGLFFMRKFIRAKIWVYRVTDDYSNMPGGAGKHSIRELEKQICEFSDRIVVTSGPLKQLFEERYSVDATILRNGVDVAHFTRRRQRPKAYEGFSSPIILYVGSLDDRFDFDLLFKTAKKNLAYQYFIIGPNSKKVIPNNIPNITALGPKPYEQIPAYMQHADIGILPLKLTPANHARSPMKIYEYGICGLPVVSTPLQELQSRREDFVTFDKTASKFYTEISRYLEQKNRIAKIAQRRSKIQSWDKIAKQLLKLAGLNLKHTYGR